jgi:dimethylhistidine N-methyltransferase
MNVHINRLQNAPDPDSRTSAFAIDALEGLMQAPKALSPKYFYDAAGSDLFEQITLLPEYYPTRTELGILRDRGPEIASQIPQRAALVEFGAGATTKVRLLLRHCSFAAYVPVDISGEFLDQQAKGLRQDFPDLSVHPLIADFTTGFELPPKVHHLPKVGFFPGSTLGNFEPQEASRFLRRAADILGKDALMILGVDLEKDEALLHAAYNDAAGITAKFNLNLLVRMNRELGANFDVSSFVHRALYNRECHRIEMHLYSRKAQKVRLRGRTISFAAGESIHTENSYKYSVLRLGALARASGWRLNTSWTDARAMFSVHLLRAKL